MPAWIELDATHAVADVVATSVGKIARVQRRLQPGQRYRRCRRRRIGQQNGKFIATHAANDIASAKNGSQLVGERYQGAVSFGMAEAVIYFLEAIQVEKQQAYRVLESLAGCQCVLGQHFKTTAVGKGGQFVHCCKLYCLDFLLHHSRKVLQ